MNKYLATALLLLFAACKKEDNKPAASSGQISKITLYGDGYTDQYVLSYNSSGAVSKMVVSGSLSGTITYSYTPQYKLAVYDYGGTLSRDSTILSNGRVVQNVHINGSGDTTITDYTYDNSGNLIQIARLEGAFESSIIYTWQNGNVISSSSDAPQNITTYTYDANTAFQAGDYLYVNDVIRNGASIISNKNLVTGYTSTYIGKTDTVKLVYEKDSKGRIVKCSEVEQPYGVGNVWAYEYNN